MGMRNSLTRPAPFNFLNGMEMRVILNKLDEIGIGAIRLELVPLSSLMGMVG